MSAPQGSDATTAAGPARAARRPASRESIPRRQRFVRRPRGARPAAGAPRAVALAAAALLAIALPGAAPLGGAGRLAAQSAPRTPLVLELPASTRALGMGNAFLLGSADAAGLFYDPAYADGLRGFSLGAERFGGESTLLTLAGGGAWLGGALAGGLQSLDYAAAASPILRRERERDLTATGALPVAEHVATLGYGRPVRGLRVGVAAKLVEQRSGVIHSATVAGDVGFGADVSILAIGLALHDFGRDLRVDRVPVPLPTRVSLQLATRRSVTLGPLDLRAAAALARSRDGTLLPGGGIELGYWPVVGRTFYLRAGARRVEDYGGSPLTLGAGFTGDAIGLDYAYESFNGAAAHRFEVRWRP